MQVGSVKHLYHFVLPEQEGKKTALDEKTIKLTVEKDVSIVCFKLLTSHLIAAALCNGSAD